MKIAYADPPYVGQAKKHYGSEVTYAGEVDHEELIDLLDRDYIGWALSCSTPSLPYLLRFCPEDIRVGAWVKPFCSYKKNVTVAYAWEPIIFRPGRKRPTTEPTVRDWWMDQPCVVENITLEKGLSGVKPEGFCFHLFEMLGMEPDDELVDLFPGSGAVTAAWEKWRANPVYVLDRLFEDAAS